MLISYNILHIVEKSVNNQQDEGSLQIYQASFNIINNIIGAGILVIPVVYKHFGIILSTILILLFSLVSSKAVHSLLYVKSITGRCGITIFSKICYGNKGSLFSKFLIIICNFGFCCAYFRIFGDIISGYMKEFINNDTNFFTSNWNNWFYILLVSIVLFPFIFKEKIEAFRVRET